MFSTGYRNLFWVGIVGCAVIAGSAGYSYAQDKDSKGSDDKSAAAQGSQGDPLKRSIPEKQRKANAKALKIELSKTYRKWLDEDVRWIITDQERSAFMQLSNDEARDQLIQPIGQRPDPTTERKENK